MELLKIFQYALEREREGKNFFEQNARRLSHAAAVEIFLKLAQEEQKHINYIQTHMTTLEQGGSVNISPPEELGDAGFFSQRAQSEMIAQTISEAMVPDLPVLRMAYLIERDFAEFYEMAAQKTSGSAKEAFELLAGWERKHEQFFKKLHDQAFEEYAQMPWGG